MPLGSTSVLLNWTAPQEAPANGYNVEIYAGNDLISSNNVDGTEFTANNLTANTEYTYFIAPDCGDATGDKATGTFTTPEADQKTLNVTVDIAEDGTTTFTFIAGNFEIGTDGKVKYEILGDNQEIEETVTDKTSVTHELVSGDYIASFELVDNDGNSLTPAVSVLKEFSLQIPMKIDGIVVFEKDFSKVDGTNIGSDWTVSFVANENNAIRFGSGSSNGSAQLPEQYLMDEFTLYLVAKTYNNDQTKLKVTVNGNYAQTTESVLPSAFTEYAFRFKIPESDRSTVHATIKIEASGAKRFYLQNLKIYQAGPTPTFPEPCDAVSGISINAQQTTATITWNAPETAPALGYEISVMNGETQVAKETVAETQYKCTDLTPATRYTFSITSRCAEDRNSEAADSAFTTKRTDEASLTILSPDNNQVIEGSRVEFSYTTQNFTPGIDADGLVRYSIAGGNVFTSVSGSSVENPIKVDFEYSGRYEAEIELTKIDGELDPPVVATRTFVVDLPDVAAPAFTPEAATAYEAIEISLNSETENATVFYSLNEGAYTRYTEPVKLDESGTYTFKAFAVKERMDTSATVSKTYTVTLPEPGVIFYEPFDKVKGTNDISDKMDENTIKPGWTATNVYGASGKVRVGTSKNLGSLETPSLDLSADGGNFILTFDADAWNGDAKTFNIVVNEETVAVTGLSNGSGSNMKSYEFEFDNGTANTKIKFTGTDANNRFVLDNIRLREMPQEPTLTVESSTMSTTIGTPVSRKLSVKGRLLEADVTVTCPEGNFSVSPATLAKEAVMGEGGAELTITYNGTKALDSVNITLASGELTKTVKVTATAVEAVEVEDLAALRAGTKGTLYKVKGKVVLTAMDKNRNYKYIQDDKAGILIDDATDLVSGTYAVGDGIEGVYGRLDEYGKQLQLVMVGDLPAATSHDNAIAPIEVTVAGLKAGIDTYCSRVVKLTGLELLETEGTWKSNTTNKALQGTDTIAIHTFLRNADFIGEKLPQGEFDLVCVAGTYNGTVQVSPRSKADIVAKQGGGDDPDECAAPTGLKVTIDNEAETATASWKGAASEYKVVLLAANNSKDTVEQLSVKTKSYTFKAVKPNVEYAWAVASVCEDGDHWTKGQNFTIKKVANEGMDQIVAGIYPNPTDGLVYVELTESARMEIFTVGGLVIRTAELSASKNEVMLNQSGIYFIRLSNAKGSIVKRVVVR
ncbi:MAG: fibronectin type III domain-containing protein [Bacteroides sp.]|nr:fibronectin type III domain-containing protein [Ruminococcus flavefaciens]MCM1554846.1 fibronectin type III domain-containing protein [Bacteroides sp.]